MLNNVVGHANDGGDVKASTNGDVQASTWMHNNKESVHANDDCVLRHLHGCKLVCRECQCGGVRLLAKHGSTCNMVLHDA